MIEGNTVMDGKLMDVAGNTAIDNEVTDALEEGGTMTPKEYLSQALFIDQRIDSLKEEARQLRETAADVCSPGFGEHHNPNHSTEAPFEKSILRLWEMEKKADDEMEKLLKLRDEIRDAIGKVPDPDQQLVLRYRYLESLTWPEISYYLNVSKRTAFRIHDQALKNFRVPESAGSAESTES